MNLLTLLNPYILGTVGAALAVVFIWYRIKLSQASKEAVNQERSERNAVARKAKREADKITRKPADIEKAKSNLRKGRF